MSSSAAVNRQRAIACPICGARAHVVYHSYPGYIEPRRFDIARCFDCDTKFALYDGGELPELYDRIYSQTGVMPGYGRYLRYAAEILREPDPLGYLAAHELNYWALRSAISREPRGSSVLDIGCGLGYLTYALNEAGYPTRGLDIAETVVKQAAERFGDVFVAADLTGYASRNAGAVDIVVLSSILAQVPGIQEFFRSCVALAKPGGKIIVITSNKGAYAPHAIWALDGPPVQLSWLSADSLSALAHRSGVAIEFMDLAGFPGSSTWRMRSPREFVSHPAVLDATGRPRASNRPRHPLLARVTKSLRKRLAPEDFLRFPDDGSRPAPALCSVFTKPA